MSNPERKPLGGRAYGHIPHLPESRVGPGDHHVTPGQAQIACFKPRDKHDRIIVQEKTDGACVSAARIDGQILALGRKGYLAHTAAYDHIRLWGDWVAANRDRFLALLEDGERVCGEWLALAHGTRYALRHEPFVAFDILRGSTRVPYAEFHDRVTQRGREFTPPARLLPDDKPHPVVDALAALGTYGYHGATDPAEGVVYRVERHFPGKAPAVDFVCKFVRQDKQDGCLLPEVSGQPPVWNWQPPRAV